MKNLLNRFEFLWIYNQNQYRKSTLFFNFKAKHQWKVPKETNTQFFSANLSDVCFVKPILVNTLSELCVIYKSTRSKLLIWNGLSALVHPSKQLVIATRNLSVSFPTGPQLIKKGADFVIFKSALYKVCSYRFPAPWSWRFELAIWLPKGALWTSHVSQELGHWLVCQDELVYGGLLWVPAHRRTVTVKSKGFQ